MEVYLLSSLGNKNVMAQNLNKYLYESGKERKDVCEDLGIKYTTFCDWCNAKTYPRIDKIELLAEYFHVEKSDLIENKKDSKNLKENEMFKRLAFYATRLDEKDLEIALKISQLNSKQKSAVENLVNSMDKK